MKTLTRTLLIGSLAVAVTFCVAGTSLAQPFPFPFWHHHHHHYGGWNRPFYRPIVYSPIVVESEPVYEEPVASNPAPLVEIQLVNPAENGLALSYQLDGGPVRSLPAGYSVKLTRTAVITFDRGSGAGQARYAILDGIYTFVPAGGKWELVHQAAQSQQVAQPQPAQYQQPVQQQAVQYQQPAQQQTVQYQQPVQQQTVQYQPTAQQQTAATATQSGDANPVPSN